MAQADLNVTPRERLGKNACRALRRQDLVPAVVYGKGLEATAVTVEPKALRTAISTEAGLNTLITLHGASVDGRVVIVKDLVFDSIRRDITHADFEAIDPSKKVHVQVPVHAIGKSQGEKDGGNLQVIRHVLEVHCLPADIPKSIDVDVAALKIGGVIHINDIKLPAGIEVPHDVNFTVITVTGHKAAEGEV